MQKKCKHMKKIKVDGRDFCVCKSKKGGYDKRIPKYANISMRFNLYVMGSKYNINEIDNWWLLCVCGKDPLAGRTPSKCVYF
jgi:hypothetical protein